MSHFWNETLKEHQNLINMVKSIRKIKPLLPPQILSVPTYFIYITNKNHDLLFNESYYVSIYFK
jgi:hypothetical protein